MQHHQQRQHEERCVERPQQGEARPEERPGHRGDRGRAGRPAGQAQRARHVAGPGVGEQAVDRAPQRGRAGPVRGPALQAVQLARVLLRRADRVVDDGDRGEVDAVHDGRGQPGPDGLPRVSGRQRVRGDEARDRGREPRPGAVRDGRGLRAQHRRETVGPHVQRRQRQGPGQGVPTGTGRHGAVQPPTGTRRQAARGRAGRSTVLGEQRASRRRASGVRPVRTGGATTAGRRRAARGAGRRGLGPASRRSSGPRRRPSRTRAG